MLPPEQIPVELRIEQLLARLSETEACGFEDLFADCHDRDDGDVADNAIEKARAEIILNLRTEKQQHRENEQEQTQFAYLFGSKITS